jgi:hypothetical protein
MSQTCDYLNASRPHPARRPAVVVDCMADLLSGPGERHVVFHANINGGQSGVLILKTDPATGALTVSFDYVDPGVTIRTPATDRHFEYMGDGAYRRRKD